MQFDTEFVISKTLTVAEVYKAPLQFLEDFLNPEHEFIGFRLVCPNDIYMDKEGKVRHADGTVLYWRNTLTNSLTFGPEPRLIIGKKPKPRRVVFEKIRIGTLIHKGEYWEDPHNGHFNRMNSPLHAFPCDYPIFNRVEDNG